MGARPSFFPQLPAFNFKQQALLVSLKGQVFYSPYHQATGSPWNFSPWKFTPW
tara:strand:- start:25299 stop:25457 length:159 start_codon:yes stop_codon:yes gene_type:complete